jgi:DNA primase large subunit
MSSIDKKATYIIDPDDFIDRINLSPYTVFEKGGVLIKITGLRLHLLLNTVHSKTDIPTVIKRKSKRNICMKKNNGYDIVYTLKKNINMPPCIKTILKDLQEPRGGKYRKRFIVNCYIVNVVTCIKCQNKCLFEALADFYRSETKCLSELTHLLIKSTNVYKPPNCSKIKSVEKLCPIAGLCKGSNPICNF